MQVIIKNKRNNKEVAQFSNVEDVHTATHLGKLFLLIGTEVIEFTYGSSAYFIIMGR